MEIKAFEQLFETSEVKTANEYLCAGWVLLNTAPGVARDGDADRPFILYALGFPAEE